MTKLPITAVRARLAACVSRAADHGERILIERRGKVLCALVPVEDVERLERLEDDMDLHVLRQRRRERNVPLEQVKAEIS
ncbi:MAG: type II toxin-antitoxin system Phd/YefM family antitoxin [Phycisphaeraceae bacterium]|nr:type II toxin-antitoxin system Phd/YefM family antitoxin [Phycisphaeraceae bacterium]